MSRPTSSTDAWTPGRDLAGIGDLNSAIAGITATRERISHLPTWPWPPQVLRGFVTALLLPVLIWLVTRYAGQLLPSGS